MLEALWGLFRKKNHPFYGNAILKRTSERVLIYRGKEGKAANTARFFKHVLNVRAE